MNWNAFMVVLPINILIIWAIVEDIKEIIKREENERIREANLLRDTIHIDVSEKDLEMLDMNIRRSEFNTRNEYLRGIIKELNNGLKIAIISDIHANITALDAVLEDINKREIKDKIETLERSLNYLLDDKERAFRTVAEYCKKEKETMAEIDRLKEQSIGTFNAESDLKAIMEHDTVEKVEINEDKEVIVYTNQLYNIFSKIH